MKNTLRIALPPLAEIAPATLLAYAWFDRAGRCARSGELAAAALATAFPARRVEAVLDPRDAIAATVQLPAVAPRLMPAAVSSALEPLVLSDVETLAIGHGPRAADGSVLVAWTPRDLLAHAWRVLAAQGLKIDAMLPVQAITPPPDAETGAEVGSDDHQASTSRANSPIGEGLRHFGVHPALTLPVDARWAQPAPRWSLDLPAPGSAQASPWRGATRWAGVAAAIWIVGLDIHAASLRAEARAIQAHMENQVRTAFALPVVIDPLRQAQRARDALLAAGGSTTSGDFVPLALAAAAALPAAAEHVRELRYQNGSITLTLDASDPAGATTGASGAGPAGSVGGVGGVGSAGSAGSAGGIGGVGSAGSAANVDAARMRATELQRAPALGVRVEQLDTPNTWRITRVQP
jgi:general secretion pathway protein L